MPADQSFIHDNSSHVSDILLHKHGEFVLK